MLSCSNHIAHFLQLLSLFIYTKTDEIVSANASAHTIRIPKAIICFEMFCIHYMPSSGSMYLASTKPKSKRKSSNGKSTRNGNESETNYGHKLEYLCICVSLWHVYFTRTCTVQISYEKWHNWHAIKILCGYNFFPCLRSILYSFRSPFLASKLQMRFYWDNFHITQVKMKTFELAARQLIRP